MKCVVVVACGLADEAQEGLGGKTPLEVARTPILDHMAARGILGLTRTTPRGATAGCQVGALALLGYDPAEHRVGAAALEALGVGVTLAPSDVALRANLVTIDTNEDGTEILGDPLGGRLPVAEAAHVARDLANAIERPDLRLVPGMGHRHVIVWRGGERGVKTVSPYDLVDKAIAGREPSGPRSEALVQAMERAREVLAEHPVCLARRARAERVPTGLWLWGPSGPTPIRGLRDTLGIEGSIVAASPIGRGLGIAAGLEAARVSGGTGDVDTSFTGKVEATLAVLEGRDLAIVHVAAADTAAHGGDAQRKVTAIEKLDEQLVGPLLEGLRVRGGDWRVLVAADHATSSSTRLHGADPVPFCVFTNRDEGKVRGQKRGFCEKDAREQGIFIQEGHGLLDRLVRN